MSFEPVSRDLLQAAVESFANDGLGALRRAAADQFAGLPTVREEDWRYTNLAAAAALSNRWLESFPGLGEPVTDRPPAGTVRDDVEAHWIEIRDGRIDRRSLRDAREAVGEAVSFRCLSKSGDVPDLHTEDALSSLNAALLADGLIIDVAPDATIDKPIGILHRDTATAASLMSQSRLVINVGAGATVEFIDAHSSSGDEEHLANGVTEIALANGAHARYVRIQERDERHMQIGRVIAVLAADSVFEHANVDVGGRLVRNDVILTIDGPGADATTSGIYLAHGAQHVDNHILADHRVGPAASRQTYRGIASGRSRCVFNGKAVVREGADGTDAEQSNHNLLLSDRAEVDTKPELEIYADDVKCAHGATVGQLDKAALFYLRSRGLDADQAAQVLTRAFASRIVSEIPVESVRACVERLVDAKLDALIEENRQ